MIPNPKELIDKFVLNKTYPSAKKIFQTILRPISEIKDECVFVFDTNTLLLPYSTSSESLSEIQRIYFQLKSKHQIIIPGQVAREFARNRPNRLKELFEMLNVKRDSIPTIKISESPILKSLSKYIEAIDLENQINEKLKEYRKTINTIIEQIRTWQWDDPVSLMYKTVFTEETILDSPIDREKISADLIYNNLNKIPPGYNDQSKDDYGIGDLLIWKTILEIAALKKHVIFVSNDGKNDWFYKSNKQELYPRFELVTEFQTISEGKTFTIIKFSEFLKLEGVNEQTLKEVRFEEINLKNNVQDPLLDFGFQSIYSWLLNRFDHSQISYVNTEYNLPFEVRTDETHLGIHVLLHWGHIGEYGLTETYKGYLEKSEKLLLRYSFNKIYLIILATNEVTNLTFLFDYLKQLVKVNTNQNIETFYGYLDDKYSFVDMTNE